MPKAKTRKAAAKRFKITASGKILHKYAGNSHLLEWKKSKRTRSKRKHGLVSKSDVKNVRNMLHTA